MASEPSVPAAANDGPDLPALAPEHRYFNRELSWLAFNQRVLAEAANEAYPCLLYTSPSPRD